MAITKKPTTTLIDSVSTKAGTALWSKLGPKTKRRIITSSAAIITSAVLRSLVRKTTPVLLTGAIIFGAIWIIDSSQD